MWSESSNKDIQFLLSYIFLQNKFIGVLEHLNRIQITQELLQISY